MRTHPTPPAPLYGLVLAGGRGSRLGRDKGALDYHGAPQACWALEMLRGLCEKRFVSIRPDQAAAASYEGLPSIIDPIGSAGPASGLLAALERFPETAWLVIAADMPLLVRPVLARLAAERDPAALATAYRHGDGTPEPLCAIWEPAVLRALATADRAPGLSLRRLIEQGPAKLLDIGDDTVLRSVNTPADDAFVRARLAR